MLNNKILEKRQKTKSIDFLTLNSKDKFLIKVINKTKKMMLNAPYIDEEKDLKSILIKLKTKFNFTEEPSIKKLKLQNEEFITNYKKVTTKKIKYYQDETFRELIDEYKKKGYKIPNLTLQHNIFKMNPLIENENEKIIDGLQTNFKTISHSEDINKNIASKSMFYLKKLRDLIEQKFIQFKLMRKNNNNDSINNNKIERISFIHFNKTNFNNMNNIKESKKQLLETIQKLLKLIEEEPLIDYTKINYNLNKKQNKTFKLFHIKNRRNSNQGKRLSRNINNIKNYFSKHLFTIENPNPKKKNSSNVTRFTDIFSVFKNNTKSLNIISSNKKINQINLFEKNSDNNILSSQRSRNNDLNTLPQTERNENNNNILTTNYSNYSDFPYQNDKDFIKFAYDNCIKDNFKDVEIYLRKYLIKYKGLSDEKIDYFLNHFNKKNFYNNINGIKGIVKNRKIGQKSETIYLHEHIIQRIKSKLRNMFDEEKLIKNLDKKYVKCFLDE